MKDLFMVACLWLLEVHTCHSSPFKAPGLYHDRRGESSLATELVWMQTRVL